MLPEIVREAASRFGERVAFSGPGEARLTYAELDTRSDEVAAGLRERAIGEGSVVALVLPSTADYAIAYVAAAKIGAITAGVNPRFTDAERSAALDVVQPDNVLNAEDVAELRRPGSAPPPPLPTDPERLVAIVLTSGTTGTPKGATFGNRELDAIGRADVPAWDDPEAWGGAGPMLASTQFAHVGFMTKLPWYLRTGATLHVLERWRSTEVLDLIERHRMTSVGGVAPQLALLLRDPTFDDHDLTSVKTIVMGGAFSPPALVEEATRRFGAAYSIRYSSTESGGIGTGTAFDADDDERLFSVGRPRGDAQVEIHDDRDQPVPVGEVGEICLQSSCMARGYWRDSDGTAAVFRGGWLHTGDLGRVDEKGLLRLAGRKKEMYVRGGYNVYPVEVEAVLASHPSVADVAVVPRRDDILGEVGVAVAVLRPGAKVSLDDLRSFAGERLAKYKLPEDLLVVDDLPLTAMQKLDRTTLRTLVDRRPRTG